MKNPAVTIILATYNWPEALNLVLQSLATQSDNNFEVVIADDGSKSSTRELINLYKQAAPFHIYHEWQEDQGFRKSKILNQAIKSSRGEYLIFLDGDCIVQPDFVAQHRKLAQAGYLVTGSRILLGPEVTIQLCQHGQWSYATWVWQSFIHRLTGQMNKWLPLFVKLPDLSARIYDRFEWRRIKGCNMAAWRKDVLRINGFDESLEGWGHEDADFVYRLQDIGVIRKSGSWATEVFHLWHKMADKATAEKNAEKLKEKILNRKLLAQAPSN